MQEKQISIKFWGVHGSLPRPGPSTLKYGGNTACVEVSFDDILIIFDAGTGIRDLGDDLLRRHDWVDGDSRITGHIFFSHLHWDHVQGFPFFAPVFLDGNEFHLYGADNLHCTIDKLMSHQMTYPNFPVELEDLKSKLKFHNLISGDRVKIGGGEVRSQLLNHPGGSLGYRLEMDGRSVVYASDTEIGDDNDHLVLEFVRGADVLIFDSMFTPDQYEGCGGLCRKSWGHSTWESAVHVAKQADINRLVLFHHGNEDKIVEQIEARAREIFPETIAAYEGLELRL
jgi:phosphoribosyl 1,2-cyclic phosphodiesterase